MTSVPTDARGRDLLAWEVELDRLELELLRVERLIKAMSPLQEADWVEPTDLPPMPAELVPRAQDVARRQQEAQQQLVRAMARTGRQCTVAQRVSAPTSEVRSVYVDLSA
jgi:hypothetical protein